MAMEYVMYAGIYVGVCVCVYVCIETHVNIQYVCSKGSLKF